MKKKEKTNISGMTKEELISAAVEIKDKLAKIYLDRTTTQVRNTRETRNLRKRQAVILTFLKNKEIHE